jgi:hypothetical protein
MARKSCGFVKGLFVVVTLENDGHNTRVGR